MLDLPPVMLHSGSSTENIYVPSDWIEGFNGAANEFISCITDGGQPSLDAHFSKKVLQVTLAAYESSRLMKEGYIKGGFVHRSVNGASCDDHDDDDDEDISKEVSFTYL